MTDIKLPARAESAVKLHGKRGKQLSPEAMSFYTAQELRARDIEVARVVLEAAAKVCEAEYQEFKNGRFVYLPQFDGGQDCADAIRALEITHHD